MIATTAHTAASTTTVITRLANSVDADFRSGDNKSLVAVSFSDVTKSLGDDVIDLWRDVTRDVRTRISQSQA